jgi:uridine phosphorylase
MTAPGELLPLLWDTSDAPSAFDPADWFHYCETITGRPTPRLPALAIQSVIPVHLEIVAERYGATIDDFTLADHPFAVFRHEGVTIVIGRSAKGSYAAGGLDEMIALGARYIVFLGGSGTIAPEVEVDDLFVPTKALRDEGVSFHYIPPSRYAFTSQRLTAALIETCQTASRPVKYGPMWTMTAHFRQAVPRLRAFRAEGCLVVNNESSAAFAVGQARGCDVAALLNVGDTLVDERFRVPAGHAKLYGRADAGEQLGLAIRTLVSFSKLL